MNWPLRVVDPNAVTDGWQPGDCWYVTEANGYVPSALGLSDEYNRDHAGKRPPIMVCIPFMGTDGLLHTFPFCVDERSSTAAENGTHEGWAVTGDLPNITVTPSIKATGSFHGYITDGEIKNLGDEGGPW